jgi:hypothetical protein
VIELSCFECASVLRFEMLIGFREECFKCKADVRVCKNCEHHDPKIYNECKEPQSERVQSRDRSNRCDYFKPRTTKNNEIEKNQNLRAAAEALFKKKE